MANGLSAVLSPMLVYPLGLGLDGSAIANVVAQAVGGRALRPGAGPAQHGGGSRPERQVMRRSWSSGAT